MEIQTVWAVYFSPTGATARVCEQIASTAARILNVPMRTVSLTPPAARVREYHFTPDDLPVIAFPTYAGKLPNKILPDLKRCLWADAAPAIAVVTFGNRAFDHSLAELTMILTQNGFIPISAAAFVTRHAFSDTIGAGRPDFSDQHDIEQFAVRSADKVKDITDVPIPVTPSGDPHAPYYIPRGADGQPVRFLKAKPRTDWSRCCQCGVCARNCPMGAINPADVSDVPGICIKCQGCVRRCTRRAKYFDDPAFLSHVSMLEGHFTRRAENQTFFPDA